MSSDPTTLPGAGTKVAGTADTSGDVLQHVLVAGMIPGDGDGEDYTQLGVMSVVGDGFPGHDFGDVVAPALLVHSAMPTMHYIGTTYDSGWAEVACAEGDALTPYIRFDTFGGHRFQQLGAFEILGLQMVDFAKVVDSSTEFVLVTSDDAAIARPTLSAGDPWSPSAFQALFTVARFTNPTIIEHSTYNEVIWDARGTKFMTPMFSAAPNLDGLLVAGGAATSEGVDPGGGLAAVTVILQLGVLSLLSRPGATSSG